jgi:hypothetical protein
MEVTTVNKNEEGERERIINRRKKELKLLAHTLAQLERLQVLPCLLGNSMLRAYWFRWNCICMTSNELFYGRVFA